MMAKLIAETVILDIQGLLFQMTIYSSELKIVHHWMNTT